MCRISLKLSLISITSLADWTMNIGRVIGDRSKASAPSGRHVASAEMKGRPDRFSAFSLRNASAAQGCRMGLLASEKGGVGCWPVARKSSLETRGCALSCMTGPAPARGAIHSRVKEYQALLAFGAKFGTASAVVA